MDARIPERALTDPVLDGLSDAAYRVWVAGLAYSVGQNSDGLIPARALRLLHPDGPRSDLARELVARGVWTVNGDGWRNLRHQDAQTTAADVERLREQARERQAKHRRQQRDALRRKPKSDKPDSARHDESRVTDPEWLRVDPVAAAEIERDVTRDGKPEVSHRDSRRDVTRDRVGEVRRGEARRGEATTGATSACPHGVVCGDVPDPWDDDQLSCPECAAARDEAEVDRAARFAGDVLGAREVAADGRR
jgi:hypothetical protein